MEYGMLGSGGDPNGSAVQQLRESASNVKEEINKAAQVAGQATKEQLSTLQEMGTQHVSRIADYVRERPITALCMGVAFGYLAAAFSRR